MRTILNFILNFQKKRALKKLKRKGLTPEQAAAEKVVNGQVWNDFCDSLKVAGGSILGFDSPDDPLTRAEGFRYLSRLVRAGLENFVEGGDLQAPVLRRLVHETVKMGNDSPDYLYRNCPVDGSQKYKITGKLGNTPFIIFSTQEGDYTSSKGAEMPLSGQLTTEEMVIGENGEIEIIISQDRQGQNWLRTTPETKMLMVRELLGDIKKETPADLKIELVDSGQEVPKLTATRLETGLEQAAQLVAGASLMFARWSNEFKKTANKLPRFDQNRSNSAGGDPHTAYYHSYWQLEDQKALVVEVLPPECVSWNLVLANHWLESLDYRFSQIHVNKHTAYYRPDGTVRIIICKTDPKLPNWLDPQGHEFGAICFRWMRAKSHPQPMMQLIPFEKLEDYRREEKDFPSERLDYTPSRPKGKKV